MRYAMLVLFFLAGCKATLETGYQPRPLNANEDARRAYYAPPFSPEAHADNSGGQSPVQPMIGR